MTLLVFGSTGQVARELALVAPNARFVGRNEADLADPAACARLIRDARPDAVINAAAWTAVDLAEAQEAAARVVNGEAPGLMAQACAELGAPFVHISTDYVFSGDGEAAWREDDATAPINAYGRSKRLGEEQVLRRGGRCAILRSSWVFSRFGANFVRTMLRAGEGRPALRVVNDQIGGPTPASAVARACLDLAARLREPAPRTGLYHLAGAPDVSWAGFASAIFEAAAMECEVVGVPSSDWPRPARRPSNSRLDCDRIRRHLGVQRPDWRSALGPIVAHLRTDDA
ncbi:dTDP-4-dehydrorhamnose reductase [Methylopila capsulata]|uniref:dTDP-4-dehydrorhamnose reductase n=1 Tax=Methylopila capsulata TaxID=61654 RepID=A0A9W6IQY4_9HYPH|nr:dTDP-4-dehydrorhamnose reductase [Methylopila capsulata]MBM7850994.1 dTDP-4-dehydrorhamnose reductase [Methylopila capsulata]GLK54052.1 NAD(P)-dependent oxidoreductase [Methylopila capsulata]